MNAISMQNLEEDKVLESQGLAAMTFTLNWSDGRATHEDEMHVEKFSVWREADILPADIGLKITGMHVGDRAQSALPGSCRRVERSSLETNPDQLSSLAMDGPESRSEQLPALGKVVQFPEVGGLHHHYERLAA